MRNLSLIIPSCSKDQSELHTTVIKSDENFEQFQREFTESYADVPSNECSFREFLSDANTDTEADSNLKSYKKRQLDPKAQSNCETDNISINETSNTQEVSADHEESPSYFKNSTSLTLTDNESDIDRKMGKIFKVHDVFSIDNSWRTAINFSKEESFENENEKCISDDLIYKAMTNLNKTSDLFVIGGFKKTHIWKNLFENNYEREKGPYLQLHKIYYSAWVVTTDLCSINLIEGEANKTPTGIIFIYDPFHKA